MRGELVPRGGVALVQRLANLTRRSELAAFADPLADPVAA